MGFQIVLFFRFTCEPKDSHEEPKRISGGVGKQIWTPGKAGSFGLSRPISLTQRLRAIQAERQNRIAGLIYLPSYLIPLLPTLVSPIKASLVEKISFR